jgi:hypothetical protein
MSSWDAVPKGGLTRIGGGRIAEGMILTIFGVASLGAITVVIALFKPLIVPEEKDGEGDFLAGNFGGPGVKLRLGAITGVDGVEPAVSEEPFDDGAGDGVRVALGGTGGADFLGELSERIGEAM